MGMITSGSYAVNHNGARLMAGKECRLPFAPLPRAAVSCFSIFQCPRRLRSVREAIDTGRKFTKLN